MKETYLLAAFLLAVFLLAVLLMTAGCQQVTEVDFYEPTAANAAYCTPATDKAPGRGPLKSVKGKSGTPDFSDGKSFNFNLSVLGL